MIIPTSDLQPDSAQLTSGVSLSNLEHDLMDDEYFLVETGQKPAPTEGLKGPGMQHWLDLGVGAMLSWGVNTFNDMEWSDGSLPIESVNPDHFDPRPLMQSLKAAGIKYVLPITKHIDAFCIWPSSTTDYHSMNSPLGKDVLGLIVEAARDEGLEVGLYYSLWDRREPSFDHDHREFAQIMKRQLTEILTNYGPIIELWVDGAWHKGGVHWPDAELWHWRELYDLIKSLQPECQVGINGTTDRPGEIIMYPCDYRIGEKRSPGAKETKVWWCGGPARCLPFSMVHTTSAGGGGSELFADGKWYYHADDHSCRSAEEIAEEIKACLESEAVYLLGIGPDGNYQLRPEDETCLRELGKLI